MILEPGRSYLALFLATAIPSTTLSLILSAVVLGDPRRGAFVLPLFMAVVVMLEIKSGVALDRWYKAKFAKGTDGFSRAVRAHSIAALVVFSWVIFINLQERW